MFNSYQKYFTMDHSEKVSLKWNDFQETLTSSFALLRNDKEFTNVTLVCEDGEQIEAHKVVLVASSPFFMELLKRNKHTHPMVYMRGVKSHEIQAILDFIYCGEANVFEVNLEAFLALAEDLKLKGLTEQKLRNNGSESMKSHDPKTDKSKTYFEDESYMSTITRKFQHDSDSLISQDSLAAQSKQTTTSIELDQPDVQVKSMMEDSGNMILVGKAPRKAMICKVCGKEGEFGNIKRHIESNHISGGTHPCDVCGKISRFRHGLSQHKLFNHYH